MAILHGSWLMQPTASYPDSSSHGDRTKASDHTGCLFIWGETWRRVMPTTAVAEADSQTFDPCDRLAELRLHPFAMSPIELADWLRSLHQSNRLQLPVASSLLGELAIAATQPSGLSTSATAPRTRTAPKTSPTTTVSPSSPPIQFQTQLLAIPTTISALAKGDAILAQAEILPQHSATALADSASCETTQHWLYPWQVQGIGLSPVAAMLFLNSLPLGSVGVEESFLGGDLRFWSHIARWSLDLLARSKFLPGLERSLTASVAARWQVLLDSSIDHARLDSFTQQMPAACRTYQQTGEVAFALSSRPDASSGPVAIEIPIAPQTLLHHFLNSTLDAQIRNIHSGGDALDKPTFGSPMQEWLQALTSESATISPDVMISPLEAALTQWTAPLQYQLTEQNLFRTCFYLHPPLTGRTDWRLEYFLQAIDDAQLLVSAPTLWNNPVEKLVYQGRTINHPQETLLAGLGLASRVYPAIEPSLQEQRPQFCTLPAVQAYDFIKSVAWRLQDSGLGVIMPESLSNQSGWASRLGLKIQAQTAKRKPNDRLGLQSLLNFRWELTIGGQSLTKQEFDRLVALNTPLVEINGEWVELRPQDIKAAQTFFSSRKDQTTLSLEDALRIGTGDTQMIEKLPVVSFEASGALQDLITTLTGKRTVEAISPPASFKGELRPYQARGVGWLAFLEEWNLGACLADDMGLGKTIEFIAFLLHLKEQQKLENPTLLVCPTSVLGNWEREVKKFGPSLKLLVHHGDKRAKGKTFAKAVQGIDLIITSYALIHRDLKDLQSVSWQGVVLDEAQNIKNSDAKQSQAVRQLETQFRIALTGTPVENRLSELWSILDFLNPGYLGPKNFFQRRFAIPIERYGDTTSLQTLRSLAQPFILRRLKTDKTIIQDLPDKQEMTVFCGLSAEQASLYQHTVEKSLAEIEASDGIQRRGEILALLVKLKQICNHPTLFLKDDGGKTKDQKAKVVPSSPSSAFETRSGKLQRLGEMLEEVIAEGDRALIFTQFAEWGKLLKAHLEKQLGRETLLLYGGTSKKQREEMVDRFQHDPQGPRIFVLSLKAGGVGLNLTRANHVFHFDRWWNPAVENQATDRVFRIGQTRNVQVHKFVCSGTLEEKIHDLIESKKALAEQVIGAGENWLTELDTDSLRNLLLLDRSAIIEAEE
ncbi:MAG: DEAD/DEAH box helicase [Scytolyngbya sp. HA4215-MV1]|nr:DEAD/DEAH box helicase [Scytolyngbya sp. HA4215-MV1]